MPDYLGSKKLPWTICLVFAIAYLVIFEALANGKISSLFEHFEHGLLFGFCVWGSPSIPDEENGCYRNQGENDNSHMYAFYIDVFMTLVVVFLFLRDKSEKKGTMIYMAIGAIILAHGALHFFLFNGINCYLAPENISKELEMIGYILFAIFSFALCLIILAFGFVVDGKGWSSVIWGSAGFTAIIVSVTYGTGSQWMLPALFAISHPLSAFTGLFTKSPLFTPLLGWAFLAATIVGILELTTCLPFYRGVGGHLWYDVTLHTAVILYLPPFVPSDEGTKKTN